MKKMYEAPMSMVTYCEAQDVIASSLEALDSSDDIFDVSVVDLSSFG